MLLGFNKGDFGRMKYQKPLFEKQKEMVFPIEIMEKFNVERFCFQCSACHACK